jgi:hypothetical protein
MVILGWHVGNQQAGEIAAREVSSWLVERIEARHGLPRKALAILEQITSGDFAIPLRIARFVENEQESRDSSLFCDIISLLPDLTGPDADGWFALLDARGRVGRNSSDARYNYEPLRVEHVRKIVSSLVSRLGLRPDQWGLLDALACLLQTLPDVDLSEFKLPVLPEDVPPQGIATRALVALVSGNFVPPEIPTLIGQLSREPARGADPRGKARQQISASGGDWTVIDARPLRRRAPSALTIPPSAGPAGLVPS